MKVLKHFFILLIIFSQKNENSYFSTVLLTPEDGDISNCKSCVFCDVSLSSGVAQLSIDSEVCCSRIDVSTNSS